MKLREKINSRMDELQAMMDNNVHLTDPLTVAMQAESVSRFWSVLEEEDKDYIQAAQHAVEDQLPWGVDFSKVLCDNAPRSKQKRTKEVIS